MGGTQEAKLIAAPLLLCLCVSPIRTEPVVVVTKGGGGLEGFDQTRGNLDERGFINVMHRRRDVGRSGGAYEQRELAPRAIDRN